MLEQNDKGIRRWRAAWIALGCALTLHVTDEALFGFLPVYNRVVIGLRESLGWVPFPTFTFRVWLTGLILGVITLFGLTPLITREREWLRVISLILAVIMVGNGLGHIVASVWWHVFAPGVYSSPLLLAAAIALFVTAKRVKPTSSAHGPN
ncbi:MAG TPA: hypothetical protein DEA22_05535 [Blastocatellia bacterium]|nr:hypothetical protein [Blastocatellia bacterium]